jgi:membrane protein DedA with SNARE-associated domain
MYNSIIFYSFVVLFALVLGSSFVPIPGVGALITGYGALSPSFSNLIGLIILVFSGMIIGDIVTFFLARKISKRTKKFLRKFKWYYENEAQIKKSLRKNTFKWVFLSRFILIGACPVTNYLCGFDEKIKFRKFIIPAMLGAIVYALEYTLIGFIFRETWNKLLNIVHSSVLIAVVIMALSFFIAHRIQKHRRKKNIKKKAKHI